MKKILALAFLILLSVTTGLHAQTPSQREDAQAERLKILRAADQIEVVQTQMEAAQTQFTTLKNEVAALQTQLEAAKSESNQLRADIVTLKTALEKIEAARTQERDVLLKEVGALVADKLKAHTPAPAPAPPIEKTPEKQVVKPAPKKEKAEATEKKAETAERGVYHTVEHGQTLVSIVQAYRDNGFNVTVDDVRASNNLTKKDVIKSGQKLFIPKSAK